jgi:hypothetical protein
MLDSTVSHFVKYISHLGWLREDVVSIIIFAYVAFSKKKRDFLEQVSVQPGILYNKSISLRINARQHV